MAGTPAISLSTDSAAAPGQPYWIHIGASSCSACSIPLALLSPLPLKIAVDNVIGSQPIPGFSTHYCRLPPQVPDTALLIIAAGLVVAIALLNQLQAWELVTKLVHRRKDGFEFGRGSSAMSSASRSLTTILGARLTLRTASNTMPLRSMDRD